MRKKLILTLLCGLLFTVLAFVLVGCDLFGGGNQGGGEDWGSGNQSDHVHNMEYREGDPATCTEDGTLSHYYCSSCGGLFSDPQGYKRLYDLTDYRLGHSMKFHQQEKKEPTCTQDGSVGSYYFCSRCNKSYSDEQGYEETEGTVIPALGHNMKEYDEIQATCVSEGSVRYYYCNRCTECFGDEKGVQKLDRNKLTVPKKAHAMTEHIGIPATCLEDGEATYYSCSMCEKDYTDEEGSEVIASYVLPATGHLYEETWSFDETLHWHAPICEHKDGLENIDTAPHDMEDYACKECTHDLYTKGLSFRLVSGGAVLDGLGSATDEDIVVPPTYQGKAVIAIYDAFQNCTSIKSVVFLSGIETIGQDAFNGCSSLESVTLPETVTTIESRAFKDCTSLTELNVPDDVKITADVFEGCNSLIQYEGGIGYVGKWAVAYDGVVKDVVFRPDTKYVVNGLFKSSRVKTAVIPRGITEIAYEMFYGCSSLTSVELPDGVTVIGADAFRDCGSLASIAIPDSVTEIGFGAFWFCTSLTKLEISKNVTAIRSEAFRECGGLNEITVEEGNPNYYSTGNCLIAREWQILIRGSNNSVIPNDGSVREIGQYAFTGCRFLAELTIPDSVVTINNSAFTECDSLTSMVIPDTVTMVSSRAFYRCRALTIYCEAVEQPTNWGEDWNDDCPIVWDSRNNTKDETGIEYAVIGGVRYALKDGEATVIAQSRSAGGNIVIPDAVTHGGTVYSVTSIVGYAFYQCKFVESVVIGDNVTKVGGQAFAYCDALASLSLGKGIVSLEHFAFVFCGMLSEVYYNCFSCEDLVYWSSDVWQGSGISGDGFVLTVGNAVQRIPDNLFNWESSSYPHRHNLREVIFEENSVCEEIGENAFKGCDRLVAFTTPDSLKKIGNSAFAGCGSLLHIFLGQNIEVIGGSVFKNYSALTVSCEAAEKPAGWDKNWCDSSIPVVWNCNDNHLDTNACEQVLVNGMRYALKDRVAAVVSQQKTLAGAITIPASIVYKGAEYPVTSVETGAFYDCELITSIVIPEGVTRMGSNVFTGCTALKSVVIPEGVTRLEHATFYGCTSLTSVHIPESVVAIENQVFDGCNRLIEKVDGVYYVGRWAIGCENTVKELSLRMGTVGIVSSAFAGCKVLQSVMLPEGITQIPDGAFYGCKLLKSIVLPEGVVTIGGYAFNNCSALRYVVVPASLREIEAYAFADTNISNTLYLMGTQADLDIILADETNYLLGYFEWYLYSETEPTEAGNYWYYGDDGITPVKWKKA